MLRVSEPLLLETAKARRSIVGLMDAETLRVVNALEFVALTQFEVATLFEDFLTAESELRKNFYIRLLLLTVYESTKTLKQVIDHRFQSAVDGKLHDDAVNVTLKQAHSRFNKMFARCESEFKNIRNWIVGHRIDDAETRVRLIEQTKAREVTDLTIEFLSNLSPVIHSLWKVWRPAS